MLKDLLPSFWSHLVIQCQAPRSGWPNSLRTIYITRGEGGHNVKRAVSLAAQGRLRGAELVTHTFPLQEITEALRVMRERIGDPLKIVIVP